MSITGKILAKDKLVTDRAFYAKVLSIVLPVAAQQAINMGVNMMDTVMLGSFGEVQLSASSLANSFYQLFTILCMGIIGGCSVLVAQFWGAKDTKRAKQTLSLAFWMAVNVGAVFAIITALFPAAIMKLFTPDEAVIAAGVRYLRITAFIYIIHGTGLVTCHLMRAVGQAKLGLYVSIVSFFFNIFFNWMFIFGKLGAPRLEIAGAAFGTLLARMSEFVFAFYFVLKRDRNLQMRIRDYLHVPPRDLLVRYFRMGAPALVSDGLLGLGQTGTSMILGRMGAAVVAANSVCMVVDRLVTVVVQGVSNASCVTIGNTVGSGERDRAFKEGYTFYILSMVLGLINGLIVMLVGPLTLRLYNLAPETITLTRQMMIAYALITVFLNIQSVMTKGVLRGGGDTKFLMIADILFLWVVSIPLGYIGGIVLHAPGWLTIILLRIDYIIKSIWCVSRLKSGKWIRNVNMM